MPTCLSDRCQRKQADHFCTLWNMLLLFLPAPFIYVNSGHACAFSTLPLFSIIILLAQANFKHSAQMTPFLSVTLALEQRRAGLFLTGSRVPVNVLLTMHMHWPYPQLTLPLLSPSYVLAMETGDNFWRALRGVLAFPPKGARLAENLYWFSLVPSLQPVAHIKQFMVFCLLGWLVLYWLLRMLNQHSLSAIPCPKMKVTVAVFPIFLRRGVFFFALDPTVKEIQQSKMSGCFWETATDFAMTLIRLHVKFQQYKFHCFYFLTVIRVALSRMSFLFF